MTYWSFWHSPSSSPACSARTGCSFSNPNSRRPTCCNAVSRARPSRPSAKASKLLRIERDDNASDVSSPTALDTVAAAVSRSLSDLVEQSGVQASRVGALAADRRSSPGSSPSCSAGWPHACVVVGTRARADRVPGSVPVPQRSSGSARILMFEEQFPEALDLLARSLRAGHALTTGIALVAEEMPEPVGPEFRLLYDRQNFGMPFPDALRDFGERIPVLDAKFFTTAVLIQRESGGNLSEVLGNLSSVIRERFRVKRQVRVLSAHGRITGWVLSGLPPALAGAFMFTSPNHMQTLISGPARASDDRGRTGAAGHRHADHPQARQHRVPRQAWNSRSYSRSSASLRVSRS